MGQATRIAEEILERPITLAEAAQRRDAERKIRLPEATPDGEIVERAIPKAAPQTPYKAEPATWD